MIVIVASHDENNLDTFPLDKCVEIINLKSLDEGRPTWFSQTANSRIFLDGHCGNKSDRLAILSGRFFSRIASPPDLDAVIHLGSKLSDEEFVCFQGSAAWGKHSGKQWLRQQDYVHPGLGKILATAMTSQGLSFENKPLFFPLGGQFIVTKRTFDAMHIFLNQALDKVIEEFTERPPFSYRCHLCGKVNDSGFGRWTDDRHLGYLLERLESLFFACSSLVPIVHSGGNQFRVHAPESFPGKDLSSSIAAWTLETIAAFQRRFRRQTCSHQFGYSNSSMSESKRSL